MPFSFGEYNSSILPNSGYVKDYKKASNRPSLRKPGQKWPLRYRLGVLVNWPARMAVSCQPLDGGVRARSSPAKLNG
jgi:hypothetical protein